MAGLPRERLWLLWRGAPCDPSRTLSELNAADGVALVVLVKPSGNDAPLAEQQPESFLLRAIWQPDGVAIELRVPSSATLASLRDTIASGAGPDAQSMRLTIVHRGRELNQWGLTLAQAGICDGDSLQVNATAPGPAAAGSPPAAPAEAALEQRAAVGEPGGELVIAHASRPVELLSAMAGEALPDQDVAYCLLCVASSDPIDLLHVIAIDPAQASSKDVLRLVAKQRGLIQTRTTLTTLDGDPLPPSAKPLAKLFDWPSEEHPAELGVILMYGGVVRDDRLSAAYAVKHPEWRAQGPLRTPGGQVTAVREGSLPARHAAAFGLKGADGGEPAGATPAILEAVAAAVERGTGARAEEADPAEAAAAGPPSVGAGPGPLKRRRSSRIDKMDAVDYAALVGDEEEEEEGEGGEEGDTAGSAVKQRKRQRRSSATATTTTAATTGDAAAADDEEYVPGEGEPAKAGSLRRTTSKAGSGLGVSPLEEAYDGRGLPRPGRWRTGSTNLRARRDRALQQRMFLVRQERHEDGRSGSFVVLGSTGNVYNVAIRDRPSCTCPDHQKGNICKHILFVLLRVLRLPRSCPLQYQSALVPEELAAIFGNAPAAPDGVLANQNVRRAYAAMAGKQAEEGATEGAEADDGEVKMRDPNGADCPVCFEPMNAREPLVHCRSSCGNAVHRQCFTMWSQQRRSAGGGVTCIYCRAPWANAQAGGAGGGSGSVQYREGYVNMGQMQGQSLQRQVSEEFQYWDYIRRRKEARQFYGGGGRRWGRRWY